MELFPKDVRHIVRNYVDRYEHRLKYTQVIKEYHSIEWQFIDNKGFHLNDLGLGGIMNYRTNRVASHTDNRGKWMQFWDPDDCITNIRFIFNKVHLTPLFYDYLSLNY